jgi:hypothetical protein
MALRSLTFEQAEAIRREYRRTVELCEPDDNGRYHVTPATRAQGAVTVRDLAKKYGVKEAAVSRIITGAAYRKRIMDRGYQESPKYLSLADRDQIRRLLAEGVPAWQVRRLYPTLKGNNVYHYAKQVRDGWKPIERLPNESSTELATLESLRRQRAADGQWSQPKPVDWTDRDIVTNHVAHSPHTSWPVQWHGRVAREIRPVHGSGSNRPMRIRQ